MSCLRRQLPLVLLLALVVLTFGRAVGFPFVNWDDHSHVVTNPLVASPLAHGWRALLLTPREGYPMPVTLLSYAWHRQVFGSGPLVFHLVNLLVHLVNIGLAYTLLLRLGATARTAWCAVAVFALHPLVVEPVCWVTGRKDLLAAGLMLASMLALLRAPSAGPDDARPPSSLRWAAATLLAVGAMLAKPSALVAPALLLLVARRRWPGLALRRSLVALLPLGTVAAILAWLAFRGEAAIGAVARRSLGAASADVLGALALQLRHVVWPSDLVASYYRLPGDPSLALIIGSLLALTATAVLAWRVTSRGSLPRLGLLLALCAYLPVAGIVGLQRWVADSYVYLPLVGLSLAVACLVAELWPGSLARVGPLLLLVLVVTLSVWSFLLVGRWSSSAGLWAPVVERYPEHPNPRARLALAHYFEGHHEIAARELRDLQARHPEYDQVFYEQSWAFARAGDAATAARLLQRCVERRHTACVEHCARAVRMGRRPRGCP